MDLKQQIVRLLTEKCSSLCLDDVEDRQRCAEVITDFIIARTAPNGEEEENDEERRS